jgi:hypothetical protein
MGEKSLSNGNSDRDVDRSAREWVWLGFASAFFEKRGIPARIARVLAEYEPGRMASNKVLLNQVYGWYGKRERSGGKLARRPHIPDHTNCQLLARAIREIEAPWCQWPLMLLAASHFAAYMEFWAEVVAAGFPLHRVSALNGAAERAISVLDVDPSEAMLFEKSDADFTKYAKSQGLLRERRWKKSGPENFSELRYLYLNQQSARSAWTFEHGGERDSIEAAAVRTLQRISAGNQSPLIAQDPILRTIASTVDRVTEGLDSRREAALAAVQLMTQRQKPIDPSSSLVIRTHTRIEGRAKYTPRHKNEFNTVIGRP